MQEQFKNIFVTLEVAKMAKEKWFSEWCAAYYSVRHETIFPNIDGFGNLLTGYDNPQECIELPTHFQLTEWLRENHQIDVIKAVDYKIYIKDELWANDIESINDALLEALKLVKHE